MRGSHRPCRCPSCCPGIIPAHAGLTTSRSYGQQRGRDHPRACGAHENTKNGGISNVGSSPRMRGSHSMDASHLQRVGIIPAHAGLTPCRHLAMRTWWNHPRACGAHGFRGQKFELGWGSSPRMRGSQFRNAIKKGKEGIIPAHAGLTVKEATKNE